MCCKHGSCVRTVNCSPPSSGAPHAMSPLLQNYDCWVDWTISSARRAHGARGKGFHRHDATIDDPVSADPLRDLQFLDAKHFDVDGPVLDRELLTDFPTEIETVPHLPKDLITAFKDPKIVFTDGITSHRRIRAAFSKEVFSFTSSIGVITGPKGDERLLRFVAAYLHSSLAQYVLLLTAYQINFERERVTLNNIRQLPFIHPDRHPKPRRAWQIINSIVDETLALEQRHGLLRQPYNPHKCDSLILEYFGMNRLQQSPYRKYRRRLHRTCSPAPFSVWIRLCSGGQAKRSLRTLPKRYMARSIPGPNFVAVSAM